MACTLPTGRQFSGAFDWLYNVAEGVQQVDEAYGPELLLRSAAWLTFKESRASFAIEHECDQQDRVRRFAAAISEFSGRMAQPLLHEGLHTLQKAVLAERALRLGIRRSPVFVGQSTSTTPHAPPSSKCWSCPMTKPT